MKKLVSSIFIASVILSQSVNAQNKTMNYPKTAKKEVVDT